MSTPSTSKYIAVQIADTRFAVRSGYAPFMVWLAERCRGFACRGEPHLRVNVMLDGATQGQSSDQSPSIAAGGDYDKYGELQLRVAFPHRADLFGIILLICLRSAIAAKHPPDLLLHSAGIVRGGLAYLFLGRSGAGKSTVCKLLAGDPSFTVLHDELVAITQTEAGFRAWSTPLWGEMPARYSSDAPLRAAFFLKQDRTNYATRLSGRKAVGQLLLSVAPPYITRNGQLEFEPPESLSLALMLAERVPSYELHFRPERSFWECIPPLFEKEPATK